MDNLKLNYRCSRHLELSNGILWVEIILWGYFFFHLLSEEKIEKELFSFSKNPKILITNLFHLNKNSKKEKKKKRRRIKLQKLQIFFLNLTFSSYDNGFSLYRFKKNQIPLSQFCRLPQTTKLNF